MGFFSYTCAKSNLPILAGDSWGGPESKVVVLFRDGSRIRGTYDGYGRVLTGDGSELELDDSGIMAGDVKLVSAKFYEGEEFPQLGVSKSDPGQGHFHNEEDIKLWYERGGFPTYDDYRRAYWGQGSQPE